MRCEGVLLFGLFFSCHFHAQQNSVARTCFLHSDLQICQRFLQSCEEKKEKGFLLENACLDLLFLHQEEPDSSNGSEKFSSSRELLGLNVGFDVGHGCQVQDCEKGFVGHGLLVEQDHNKFQVEMASRLLEREGARVTIYSCEAPSLFCSFGARSQKALKHDVLLSIHNNAGMPSMQGTEVWTLPSQEKSKFIAQFLQEALNQTIWSGDPERNRGVNHHHLSLLTGSTEDHAVLLIASFFLTSSELKDRPHLAYRYSIGAGMGIAKGLKSWFQNQHGKAFNLKSFFFNPPNRDWPISELPLGLKNH